MLDWNDLRYVQAIARAGNIADAAEALRMHQSTVFRRLNAIEKDLGVRLFERFSTGYVATSAGEEFCQTAERIEADILKLDRKINGQDMRPSGVIRVTTNDILLKLLTPGFAALRQAYPEIELEVMVSAEVFNLAKRDADIAIRMTKQPPELLVGRRVGKIALAVYASKGYLKTHPNLNNLSNHDWIGFDESLVNPDASWLKQAFPNIRFCYRINTCTGLLAAVKEHLGLAILPCYAADREPDLVQVHPPIAELQKDLWILTHEDLRYVARVQAFIDFIASALAPQRALLEGQQRSGELIEIYTNSSVPVASHLIHKR